MRYIHSAAAKWRPWPRHHGHMITFVTPPAPLLFTDTVGREMGHVNTQKKKNDGGQRNPPGLSDMILTVALNGRHLFMCFR